MLFLKGGTVLVDTNLILRKITELERYLSQVMEFSDLTIQRYKTEWKTQRIIERTLQIMIETCAEFIDPLNKFSSNFCYNIGTFLKAGVK